MKKKVSICMLIMCCFMVSASAETIIIEYELGGSWVYEQEHPETLSLTSNPAGGVTATMNVPSGIEDGGLTASRHSLPGFSLSDHAFVELDYSFLSSSVSGVLAFQDLILELEFFDAANNFYEIAIGLTRGETGQAFESWFAGPNLDDFMGPSSTQGLATDQGTLGLSIIGNTVMPYFKDVVGQMIFPFSEISPGWDIAPIVGAHDFRVDNDFEGSTLGGGSVSATVTLERVVYGVASPVPEPTTIALLSIGLAGLAGAEVRRRRKKKAADKS